MIPPMHFLKKFTERLMVLSVMAIGFFSILLLGGSVGSSSAVAQEQRSRIVIPERTLDFGSVVQGDTVVRDFSVKNDGNAPLYIQRVVSACGCTATNISKEQVNPGDAATIRASFDTTGFSGQKTKTIRVFTSDLDEPSFVLSLKGTIVPDLVITPSRIAFDDVSVGSEQWPPQATIQLTVRQTSPLEIVEVQSLSPAVIVTAKNSSPKSWTLLVALDPKASVGELRERLVVSLRGGKEDSVNIPVFARIVGSVRATPPTVSLGIIEGTQVIERQVKLESLGKGSVTFGSVTTSDKALKGSVVSVGEGRGGVLTISVDPKLVNKELRATVSVSGPQEGPITISVYGIKPPVVR